MEIGGFLPLLGESIGEIAARSRSSHRSQGYGTVATRGSRLDDFQPLDGKPAGKDLFDGLDMGWSQFAGGEKIAPLIDGIIDHFNAEQPSLSVPALLEVRTLITDHGFPFYSPFGAKRKQLDLVIQHCLGLYVETTVPQAEAVPGETLKMHQLVIARTAMPVRWRAVRYRYTAQEDKVDMDLHENQPMARDAAPQLRNDAPLSQPYWLRGPGTPGLYSVEHSTMIGKPEDLPAFGLDYVFEVGGQELVVEGEPLQITADPVKGEVRRKLDVIPPVSLALTRDVELFAPESERTIEVEIKAYRPDQAGTLKLAAPAGWTVAPESQPFHLAAVGDHARLAFTVHAPSQPGTAFLTAEATVGRRTYNTTRQEIRYDHIPFQLLQPPARLKAICLDLQIRGKNVGYLPGAGDKTAEALEAMGYAVTMLSGADLTAERLRAFDAVVVGVRAFNVRTDLVAGLPALFAYVENGGTVVEQYNTPGELKTMKLAPYALELSRNLPQQRVTDENAPVTLLVPEHPAFNVPNRLTPADFDGWVQERGLNFPVTWDQEHFETLLACNDAGEAPLKSGLLVAHYGKGYFVYTGLSFFRQLPAGVPGAYRLFANLVSLGK